MTDQIKAIVLAAGRGSRLEELTDDCPKALVEYDGKPLFERQLENFLVNGITDVGIVVGYKQEAFEKYDVTKFVNQYWDTTDMVFSLRQADEWLSQNTCIVSYGDIFYSSKLLKVLSPATVTSVLRMMLIGDIFGNKGLKTLFLTPKVFVWIRQGC